MTPDIPCVVGMCLSDAISALKRSNANTPKVVYYQRDRRPDASLIVTDVVVRQKGCVLTVCKVKNI